MLRSLPLLTVAFLASTTLGAAAPPTPVSSADTETATSRAKLNILAQDFLGWKYFGSATDNPEFNDTAYVSILKDRRTFGQITPSNSMKWESTEPSRGNFTFANGDFIQQFAAKNRQLVRGHNCVWHSQLPNWVPDGGFDNKTLLSIVSTHCGTLVKHYAGKIYSWDVINEPFNEDGTFRETVFFNTTGTSYIPTALKAAHAADPHAKLYINDFNLEFAGPKVAGMAALAKSLLKARVPLHGIGFQGHLILGQVPDKATLVSNLELFTSIGLEVAYTELDIRMDIPVTDAKLAQQKADYETVISACKAVKKCVGVTVWDYTDKYSWIPGVFPTQGAALPWDQNLVKKPAYDGIVLGMTSRN